MSKGHTKAGTAGAFGHDGSSEAGYNVHGRSAGGKLHRAGAKKQRPEKASPMASKAVVMHKVKAETALEAKIVEALKRANGMIVANREAVAAAQFAQLEAASNVAPFVSAAEGARDRLIAAGIVQGA